MTAVLSVIQGDNCDLMAEVARLWMQPTDWILDTTYGRGAFWTIYRPRRLIISEHNFTRLPYGNQFADVVIYDPPYTTTGGEATDDGVADMHDRYGMDEIKGWRNLFDRNQLGLEECARVSAGLVMVKCADYVESGARRWGHRFVVEEAEKLGLRQVDEFILYSGPGPQPGKNLNGTPRRQVHSRMAHSFLCVFRKLRRNQQS